MAKGVEMQIFDLANLDPVELDKYLPENVRCVSTKKQKMHELDENYLDRDMAQKVKAAKRQRTIREKKKQEKEDLLMSLESAKAEIRSLQLEIAKEKARQHHLEGTMEIFKALCKSPR